MIDKSRRRIVGVGSALVDILLHESDVFVGRLCGSKGGMTLVEKEFIDNAVRASGNQPQLVPGGSACNTIVGVGRLGCECAMVGKLGEDDLARLFRDGLQASHVEPVLTVGESATGNVLSIITPDAERTMFTYLGASAEMRPDEIDTGLFAAAAVVHVEGYLLFDHKLIRKVMEAARAAGAVVSLDLASYTVVAASKAYLGELVDEYVDILLANEDEARVFTGLKDERKALDALAARVECAVLKVGKRGSRIAQRGETCEIPALGDGSAVDTTGAGDLWASGFLYGLVSGLATVDAGKLGSACGYEVCQVVGAAIPDNGWRRLHRLKDKLGDEG